MSGRFSSPPPALRRAHLDNLVLVPASLLPFKAEYKAIANQQTPGTVMVVLPVGDTLPRRTLEQVVTHLRTKGRPVRTYYHHRQVPEAIPLDTRTLS
jgi:hypothetical protein